MDDAGVLEVEYTGPYEIVEMVMPASSLMSFDQIADIFDKMILIVDGVSYADGGKWEYAITTIRLGLMSIREQGAETGLLIPVWDFLGYEVFTGNGEKPKTHYTNELEPFLTINAIDGSIIDRALGY